MKVIDWISYKEAGDKEDSLGGWGGWFNAAMLGGPDGPDTVETKTFGERHTSGGTPWDEYVESTTTSEKEAAYAEALRKSIVQHDVRYGGFWHQYSENGVPLFEDGTVATFSMRAWGDLLAAIWSDVDGKPYCYADFAWYSEWDEKKE